MTEHSADTVERVAKAINGPRDAEYIGREKLHRLQDHKWENQTTPQERVEKISAARAALSALTVEDATHWAIHSKTGVLIGLWDKRRLALNVLRERPDATLTALHAIADTPKEASE